MAKSQKEKVVTENTEEQPIIETEVETTEVVSEATITEHSESEENQMTSESVPEEVVETAISKPEVKEVTDSIPVVTPTKETELQFLERILHKQHGGGFGRHLDDMINERIKSLK